MPISIYKQSYHDAKKRRLQTETEAAVANQVLEQDAKKRRSEIQVSFFLFQFRLNALFVCLFVFFF